MNLIDLQIQMLSETIGQLYKQVAELQSALIVFRMRRRRQKMANIKIGQLTNKTTLSDTDIVIIEDATSTKKMTVGKLKEILGIDKGGVVDSGSNTNGSCTK